MPIYIYGPICLDDQKKKILPEPRAYTPAFGTKVAELAKQLKEESPSLFWKVGMPIICKAIAWSLLITAVNIDISKPILQIYTVYGH